MTQRSLHSLELDHFLNPTMARAPVRRKPDKRGFLNLSSNEFLHRDVARIVAIAYGHLEPDHATRYPYWPAFERELALRFGLDQSQVLITAGSDSAYRMLLTSLEHPDRVVVTQAPNYEQLGFYASIAGLDVRAVRYRKGEGFVLQDFLDALGGPPRTVWISNPNAPSGWLMPLVEMAELASCCAAHGHLLVIDEAYVDFADVSHFHLLGGTGNVVIIRSFSKGWAMAGARLALVAASPALVDYLRGWNAGNAVSGLTLQLARELFEHETEFISARRELNTARDWFADAAARQAPGLRPLPSEANFVNLDVGSARGADALTAALRSRGLLVRAMGARSLLQGCVRVTAAQHDILESVLEVVSDTAHLFGPE